jgi:hypothetical protein
VLGLEVSVSSNIIIIPLSSDFSISMQTEFCGPLDRMSGLRATNTYILTQIGKMFIIIDVLESYPGVLIRAQKVELP